MIRPTGPFRRPATAAVRISAAEVPRLHVVIDTEEEFDWHAPYARANTSVTAMRYVGRVQAVFDRFGIVPTYVVDYPVATQADGYETLGPIVTDGRCEIGAHLHPWVNPPFDEPVSVATSFTCNLPAPLQQAKIERLCEAISLHLGVTPRMFKAGRYGLGPTTIPVLEALGFDVDGSVCPRFDFSDQAGPDFASWDSALRFLTPGLLEVPCTVDYTGWMGSLRPVVQRAASSAVLARLRAPGVLARLGATNRIMLSPEGNTFDEMRALTDALLARGQRHFTLSFHSPSVDPGHTPYVRTREDLDRFLQTIELYCDYFFNTAGGRPITSSETRSWIRTFVEPAA